VVWSFFLKSLGVLVLRYHRNDQEYRFPFNLRIAGVEIPIGLGATTLALGLTAVANLFSKKYATIYGVLFTVILFALFTASEHINRRKGQGAKQGLEEFNLDVHAEVAQDTLRARPASVLVAVRDSRNLIHLRSVVRKTNPRRQDIVVMTARPISTGAGEYRLAENQLFTDYERELFSNVVTAAEKEGKTVELLVVPGRDPFEAIVRTAARIQASRVVLGASRRMEAADLAQRVGLAWEALPEPRPPFSLEVIPPEGKTLFVNLGPHPPRLWPEDLERLHALWLRLSQTEFSSGLHHRDVTGVALKRLERDLEVPGRREEAIADFHREMESGVSGVRRACRCPCALSPAAQSHRRQE
jgi:nucleotide-binding universal stress UspA family protein